MSKIIKLFILIGIITMGYYEYNEMKKIKEERNKKIMKTNLELEFQFSPRKSDFYMGKTI